MIKKLKRDLDFCFHPPKGKAGLKRRDPKPEKAAQYLDKALHNLRAMKIMHDHEIFDWTIICGYYAFYNAVLASLWKIGIEATNHFCALTAFRAFYVERGTVDSKYAEFIHRAKELEEDYANSLEKAQESRVIVQYNVAISQNEDADWILEEARSFVEKIEEVLAR